MYWIAFIVTRSVPRQRGPSRRNARSVQGAGVASRRTSTRRFGIAAFFRPRSLRGLILALPRAHLLKIGLTMFTVRQPGFVAIGGSPLQIRLSDLLPSGGPPLAYELPAFLGVFVGH
jgi:hypothetical protein